MTRKPIRVLPKDLAEKIAAGEVVERPGSVIKELVENSIDAGAQSIRIELEQGGAKRMSILDDGHGIVDSEVHTALERHATSKISQLDDLWNLHTMGFRGEALPSIAAVSRFTLESRALGENGRTLYLEGGKLIKDEALSSQSPVQVGTRITVEDLFYNVPARLKFLRSKSGESAHIRELIERLALCNPKIAFTLTSDGRKSLSLASADQAQRVADVLDTKPSELEEFESQFEDIQVHGWLDRNSRASNSRYLYLSVNGRMVRDKLLQQAVLVALRPRMMEGEYPKVYVAIEVAPENVDANVHPAKSEVRFHRSRDVFQVVHGALERLAKTPSQAFYATRLPESTSLQAAEADPTQITSPASTRTAAPESPQAPLFSNDRVSYKTKSHDGPSLALPSTPATSVSLPPSQAQPTISNSNAPGFHRLHYIGQLKNTYLLFQDDHGLVLIDQHAAHERINYEKIKADFLEHGLRAQPLLISAIVKCTPDDVALALDYAQAFARLGFEFEAFGDTSLVLRAAPEELEASKASELFKALLEELRDSDVAELLTADPSRLSAKLERILATAACHSSVRAGQSLSAHEARELALQMDETESSLNCPHGRPASIRMTFSQIEGLFKR